MCEFFDTGFSCSPYFVLVQSTNTDTPYKLAADSTVTLYAYMVVVGSGDCDDLIRLCEYVVLEYFSGHMT